MFRINIIEILTALKLIEENTFLDVKMKFLTPFSVHFQNKI